MTNSTSDSEICCICGRVLGSERVEEHHLVPKTFKGKGTVPIHQICHQKLHATLCERDMLNYYHTVDHILEHEEIQKFIRWVRRKAIDFYSKNDDTKDRKRKR